MRNYIIARGPCNNVKHIQTIADSFKFDNIIPAYDKHANINTSANSKPSDIFNHFYADITNIGGAEIYNILTQTDWIDKIKYKVVAYLSADYTEQCNMYYKAVDTAEILVNKNRCKPDYTSRIEVMSAVADSLIYRQEGYVCPATVMHIVRGIQATHERTVDNANNANNTNNTQVPPNSNNPGHVNVCVDTGEKNKYVHCLIGAYGYILSALEQLGYIYRMCIVYCDGKVSSDSKCKDKLLKYDGRYKAAMKALRDLPKKTQNIAPT